MSVTCTRCDGTGFLNCEQIPIKIAEDYRTCDKIIILKWIEDYEDHDVSVCDCCGDTDDWYDEPGQHYNSDLQGPFGPYAYNGGLCECH